MSADTKPAAGPGDGRDAWLDVCRGALVGAAVGDALGAPVEGWRGPVPDSELDRLDAGSGLLRYTDDTAMTVGLAESLLACEGLHQDHLAATFAASFERDPDRGYGPGTASLLRRIQAGEPWGVAASEQFGGQGSLGNGAAMRVAPLGLVAAGDPGKAAELARRSAVVTHTHPLGVEGAAVQAAAVAIAAASPPTARLDGADLLGTLAAITTEPALRAGLEAAVELAVEGAPEEIARGLGTSVAAVEAVPTALCVAVRHQASFEAAVLGAVGLGGDTDTIASMAGAVVGAHLGGAAIPERWRRRLELAERLDELADRLAGWRAGEV